MRNRKVRLLHHFFNCGELVFEGREESVAFDGALDEGEVDIGAKGQGLGVDLGAATDEDVAGLGVGMQLGKVRNGLDTRVGEAGARKDDGRAIGKRLANGLEGFAAHDDDVAGGHLLEPLEVLRQVPGDFVALADDAVEGHGGDGFELLHARGKEQ